MANLVSDIINEAFIALGVIQPGGSITSAIQTDAFLRLNQMWLSWGTEKVTTNAWYHQTFNLGNGTTAYTLGTSGASLVASGQPSQITGAESISGNFRSPVRVVSFEEFDRLASDPMGSTVTLVNLMGADNSFPNINIRVFPVPNGSGQLVLDYYGPMTAFTSTGQSLSLAPEYELALWTNLAVLLYPNYQRANYDPTALFSAAQNAKAAIAAKNASINTPATPAQAA